MNASELLPEDARTWSCLRLFTATVVESMLVALRTARNPILTYEPSGTCAPVCVMGLLPAFNLVAQDGALTTLMPLTTT